MEKNDTQLTPGVDFTNTKANIEAIANPVEGMQALATDTHERGAYDNGAWVWSALAVIGGIQPGDAAGGDLSGTYPNPTLSNDSVIAKVLTAFSAGAGTVSASDSILSAFQKIIGNKDVSDGYVGKTLEKINFWNTARTFMSFLTNGSTAARTYTFKNRDGQILDDSDYSDLVAQIAQAVIQAVPNYLTGLKLSNNGTDPTNDINIAAGQAMDSTNATMLILASALIKRLDAAWAVGTNQGGLDTGSIVDTTYHVWLIKRSDTGVVDVLFSTSASAPTMPANYDYKRRIGSIVRLAGAIKGFIQDGDDFTWDVPTANTYNNPGTSAITRTLVLPTGIRVKAKVGVIGDAAVGSGSPGSIYVSDLSVTDGTANAVNFSMSAYSAETGESANGCTVFVYTNTSAQIRVRCAVSTADTYIIINSQGWTDKRGKEG